MSDDNVSGSAGDGTAAAPDQADGGTPAPSAAKRRTANRAVRLFGAGALVTAVVTAAFDTKLPPYKGD